jgi:hypothetical protein
VCVVNDSHCYFPFSEGKPGFKKDEAIRLKFTTANTNELMARISLALPSYEKDVLEKALSG